VLALILIWLALPHGLSAGGLTNARQGAASAMLSQLEQAVKLYELDHEAYPVGDGTESRALLTSLKSPGPKKPPYFQVEREMVDAQGNIITPLGEDKIFSYRCPGAHNPKSFDLWCEDSKGRPDGINNWEK
jgi:hypothetical protein